MSQTNVSGYLNVENEAYFKNLIKLDADNKLYWGTSSTSYIVGGATTMTIESNDYLNIYSDFETKIHSYQMKLEGVGRLLVILRLKTLIRVVRGKPVLPL